MDFIEFEKLIKQIDRKKYHVGRTMRFTEDNIPYIDEWDIFRKDMSTEEYFDTKNLAILSSKYGNTLEDIKEFIEKENQ